MGVGLSDNYLNGPDNAVQLDEVTVKAKKNTSNNSGGGGFAANFLPAIQSIIAAGPDYIRAFKNNPYDQSQQQNPWGGLWNGQNGNTGQQASMFSNPIVLIALVGVLIAVGSMVFKGMKTAK